MSAFGKYKISSLFLFLVVVCWGCSPLYQPDEVMSTVNFEFRLPSDIEGQKFNFTLTYTNINTHEKVQIHSINKSSLSRNIQRGLYRIHVDGVVVQENPLSNTDVVRVRGYMNQVLLLQSSEKVVVPLVILNL